MTVTDNDFEQRLRRELAELANVPPDPSPELAVSRRRRRPLTTVAGALVVVLVLVTASLVVARVADRRTTVALYPRPRLHAIFQPPAALTGSTRSILTAPISQVCERWRELPSGIDCIDLEARYIWQSSLDSSQLSYLAIEVVGKPDPKLAGAGYQRGGYPVYESVSVRGRRARLFGDQTLMTMRWQARRDLHVFLEVRDASGVRTPDTLRRMVLEFARGLRPVETNPAATSYVLRSGSTKFEYAQTGDRQGARWTLTWRPQDRRVCATLLDLTNCVSPAEPEESARIHEEGDLHGAALGVLRQCPEPWVATQGIVFGSTPERTRRVVISYARRSKGTSSSYFVSTDALSVPGAHALRVFVVALDEPLSAGVSARDAADNAIAAVDLPRFTYTCAP